MFVNEFERIAAKIASDKQQAALQAARAENARIESEARKKNGHPFIVDVDKEAARLLVDLSAVLAKSNIPTKYVWQVAPSNFNPSYRVGWRVKRHPSIDFESATLVPAKRITGPGSVKAWNLELPHRYLYGGTPAMALTTDAQLMTYSKFAGSYILATSCAAFDSLVTPDSVWSYGFEENAGHDTCSYTEGRSLKDNLRAAAQHLLSTAP